METLKISEFIKGRNVNYDTVRRYLKRNPELFKGHIGRANNIELDEVAVQLLEEKYPLPEPVQVIQDVAARDKLQEITEKYAAAMEKITALTEQNAQLLVIQSKQRFLEEENRNLVDKIDERDRQLQEISDKVENRERKVKVLQRDIQFLKEQLEVERNKSWWDKLRGR